MSMQEINLYHPIFRRQPKRFSAVAMLQAVLVLLVAGLALYGFDLWQMHNLEGERTRAQQAAQQADAQLTRAATLFGLGPLRSQTARLEKRAAALRHLQTILLQSHKAAQGDAPVLVAVSRSVVPGLWIRSLQYDRARRLFVVRGNSEKPTAVPVFLSRMVSQKLWTGMTFQGLRVMRTRKGRGYLPYVSFLASTLSLPARHPS